MLFGLAIVFVSLATAACFWMRYGRWASFLVSLVWLLNVVLCGLGAGEAPFFLSRASPCLRAAAGAGACSYPQCTHPCLCSCPWLQPRSRPPAGSNAPRIASHDGSASLCMAAQSTRGLCPTGSH